MSLEKILARTAARKAAGLIPVYRGRSAVLQPAPASPTPRRYQLNCLFLGERVPGQPCGSTLARCEQFGDVTSTVRPCKSAARCCQTCESYAPTLSIPPTPSDVIGRNTQESP